MRKLKGFIKIYEDIDEKVPVERCVFQVLHDE